MKPILAVILAGLALLTFYVISTQKPEQAALVATTQPSAATPAPVQTSPEGGTLKKLRQDIQRKALETYLEFTGLSFQPHIVVGKHEVSEPRPDTFVFSGDFNDQGQALYFAVGKANSADKFINYISSLHGLPYESFRKLKTLASKRFENPRLLIRDQDDRHILVFWGLEDGVYKLAAQIQLTSFSETDVAEFKSALGLQGE